MRIGVCWSWECHPLICSAGCIWPCHPHSLATWQKPTTVSISFSLVTLSIPATSTYLPYLPESLAKDQLANNSKWPDPGASVEASCWYHICLVFSFSLQMKTNVSVLTFVEELPVTTPWGATSVCALPAFSTNSSAEDAKTSTNVALHRPPAVMAVPILRAATCVAVHQVTSE